MCCQGQSAAAQGPLWWVVRHSLGLQGRVGMIDLGYGNGVPPLSVQADAWTDLEGCWGCGGCFTRRSFTVEISKWRKEGGWHSDQDKH